MSSGSFNAPTVEELQPHLPQYALDSLVAVGGMGAVYHATQVSVDRPVALKILPPDLAGDEQFLTRFKAEAKAMARLSHRNLVQLYDFGESNGIFWMVQEWVDGKTIFEVIHEEGKLAPKEAAALVAQACEGLGYAHKQGIIHRDVKPANMMVDRDGILKLMDFGLARSTKGGQEAQKAKGGARFATEEYAAPELWDLSMELDQRVDIFALGVLLYETLTGARPTGEFQMPSELRPGLDTRYDAIVVRAMQRQPQNRYNTCAELMAALREVVTTAPQVKLKTSGTPGSGPVLSAKPITPAANAPAGGPALAMAKPEMPVPKRKSKGALVGTLSVLLLLGALGGGWMYLTRDKEDKSGGGGEGVDPFAVAENGGNNGETIPKSPDPPVRPDRPNQRNLAGNDSSPTPRPTPTPEPEPEPEPAPIPAPDPSPAGIAQVLADLDLELQGKAGAALERYKKARATLEPKYLEECAAQKAAASAAGDLDGVLFWQEEERAIKQDGEPPSGDRDVPERVAAMRSVWRKKMDPLKAPLASMQSAYVQQCDEMAAATDRPSDKLALKSRGEAVKVFGHFVALAEGSAPPFVEDPFAGEDPGNAPSGVTIGGSLASLVPQLKAGDLSMLPTGTKEYKGNYYLVVPGPLNWDSAKVVCEQHGGHLATLANPDEWAWYLQNLGPRGAPSAFLGARLQGGEWSWITGEPWPANVPWAEGQPSGDGQEVLGWEYGGFNDEHGGEAQGFAIEWEAEDLPKGKDFDLVAQVESLLPAAMQTAFKTNSERLVQLERAKDETAMKSLIKSYGRKLVKDEKTLTQQGKIGEAKVVRQIKNGLLVRLEELGGGKPGPHPNRPARPAPGSKSVVIINNGDPGDECIFDRKEWKRKGKVLICEGVDRDNSIYPSLKTATSIGRGDFKVTFKMTCSRIGATGLLVMLGETRLQLDNDDGQIEIRISGPFIDRVRGANLGSLAKVEAPFECVLQRTGTQFQVLIDGKEGLKATIDEREIGPITLRPGSGRLELESFRLEGGLEAAPKMQRLANAGSRRLSKSEVQLVPTANKGLTALFIAWTWNEGGRNELWAQRSRDGGTKWDDDYQVIDMDAFDVGMTSFSAACDERRDEMFAVVATGKANQRLYLLKGRNGGRNWSSPEEITDTAKKPGWNVRLSSQGVCLKRSRRKEGRILLPMHAGTDRTGLHMLVSDSGGREWKTIGPLTQSSRGGVELMEDEAGTIWAAVGGPGSNGLRTILSSVDGGDTWTDPVKSTLIDPGYRGALASGMHPDKKPVWYYATAKPVLNASEHNILTHLTLYFSRDQGKTWKELRRIHYGGWSYPTVIPLGPNRLAVSYLAASSNSGSESIRFVDVDGLWER